MNDKIVTINFSQIARNIQSIAHKTYCILRKIILICRVPIKMVQLASTGLMLLSFTAIIPACLFLPVDFCMKISVASIISVVTYFVTEGALYVTKKKKK